MIHNQSPCCPEQHLPICPIDKLPYNLDEPDECVSTPYNDEDDLLDMKQRLQVAKKFKAGVTVGELREYLSQLDDDTCIIIKEPYRNNYSPLERFCASDIFIPDKQHGGDVYDATVLL